MRTDGHVIYVCNGQDVDEYLENAEKVRNKNIYTVFQSHQCSTK